MEGVNIDEILRENVRRNHSRVVNYDPIRGIGCLGVRREVDSPDSHLPELVPEAMLDDRCYIAASGDAVGWVKLRSIYDFEYWAAKCVKIKDKLTGRDVPFVLNRPQRRVLGVLEKQRLAGRPLRLIMLKARQWGGSTLCYLLIYLENAKNQPNSLLLKIFNTNMTVDYLCTLHYFPISSSLISPIRVVSI